MQSLPPTESRAGVDEIAPAAMHADMHIRRDVGMHASVQVDVLLQELVGGVLDSRGLSPPGRCLQRPRRRG